MLKHNKGLANHCVPGSKTKQLITILSNKDPEDTVTDVLIHMGTNDLPHTTPQTLANDLAHTLHLAQQKFPNATIFYSPILPKTNEESLQSCDKINKMMELVCQLNDFMFINTRPLFANRDGVRWDKFSVRDYLHLNRSGVKAIAKHLKYAIVTTRPKAPPPYTPSS